MNERQRRFADYYIKEPNASKAAVKAGYSEKYANTNAGKLLKNTTILSYIEERFEELKKDSIAEQDEVMQLLTSVARGELQASTLIGVGGGEERIANNMPPSMQERIKAAELLGKRYALFTEKVEQTNRNIEIDVGEWDED